MTHGSHYLGKLYNDLIANSPQTISIDIPSDMGKGRIAQTQIKHGIIFSDWQMCYQSDMNVQGTVSKDYMQIIFCLNDAISWGIMDEKRSITIQKNESCIYAGHGGTEYACYKKDSNFSYGFSRGKCCCANRERPIGHSTSTAVTKRPGNFYDALVSMDDRRTDSKVHGHGQKNGQYSQV